MSATLTLSAATGASTGWLDLAKITGDISYTIKGTWAGGDKSISLDVSLDPKPDPNSTGLKDYDVKFTHTANQPITGIPRIAAAYVRWRRAGTWGPTDIARIHVHGGLNADGKATELQIQSAKLGADNT
jgi:hypothetical protein